MGIVIQFPKQKKDKDDSKGNASLNVVADFIYQTEKQESQARMERITARLNRINALLRELK